jgi:hypothetical protein
MEPNEQQTRELLQMLRFELNYLEQGGFARDRATMGMDSPFLATSLCINFGDPLRRHACRECGLHRFVPEERQHEEFPCHFIPLNSSGDTIARLIAQKKPERLEIALKHWLRATIAQLEASLEKESREK